MLLKKRADTDNPDEFVSRFRPCGEYLFSICATILGATILLAIYAGFSIEAANGRRFSGSALSVLYFAGWGMIAAGILFQCQLTGIILNRATGFAIQKRTLFGITVFSQKTPLLPYRKVTYFRTAHGGRFSCKKQSGNRKKSPGHGEYFIGHVCLLGENERPLDLYPLSRHDSDAVEHECRNFAQEIADFLSIELVNEVADKSRPQYRPVVIACTFLMLLAASIVANWITVRQSDQIQSLLRHGEEELKAREFDSARADFNAILTLDNTCEEAYWGLIKTAKMRHDRSAYFAAIERCMATAPRLAYKVDDCAWDLLKSSDKDLIDVQWALTLAKHAASLSKHAEPYILETLALAQFRNGLKTDAIETQKKALSLLPKDLPQDRRQPYEDHLKEFESGKLKNE